MKFLSGIDVRIANDLACKADSLIRELGFGEKKICLISDEKIWKSCARFFANELENCESLILKNPQPDEKNLKIIRNALERKNSAKKYDLIIGVGSGVINDLCKFTSCETAIPYVIFASAPSMNGYLSRNASIMVRGHKKTLAATLPLAVYADLAILKSAPKTMIQAGIGDSLCFYSCWFDWLLSHLILDTKFDAKPFEILRAKMEFLVKNYRRFKLNDDELLKILMEILLLSGTGMTLAGGSYPASQSEHLIGHAFEMKYPKKSHKILHGLQIAVTTLTTVKLQEKLLAQDFLQLQKTEFPTQKIEKFFGKKIAQECKKEYCEKINFDLEKINKRLELDWKRHRKVLQKILLAEKTVQKILQHFKIKITEKSLELSSKQYQELAANAKFIRNRFTCLDFK